MIDLRSDTLTKPSKEMLDTAYSKRGGDEFYSEDEDTKILEKYCAEFFGKEAALFIPSGMLANLVTIKSYICPGESIITHSDYYINYFQSQPITQFCGAHINALSFNECDGAFLETDTIKNYIEQINHHPFSASSKLIWLENTINALSGKVYELQVMQSLFQYTKDKKLPIHIDGARILNACIAKKTTPKEYAEYCDSLSLSFSKGLGAPFGSILLGTQNFIDKAKLNKKAFGGGLHQSGVIANMCLYALKNNLSSLAYDHEKAITIAKILENVPELSVQHNNIETNIIMFKTSAFKIDSKYFCNLLLKENVKAYDWNKDTVRLITYKDITMENVVIAANKIIKVAKNLMKNKYG